LSLETHLRRFVSSRSRELGQSYFLAGRVGLIAVDNERVLAKVRGTNVYRVVLERNGFVLYAACTCPFFEENFEICKHIWATLLAADRRRALADSNGSLPNRLQCAGAEIDEDWDDLESDLSDPDATSSNVRDFPRPPAWKQSLAALRSGPRSTTPLPECCRPQAEITYTIDADRTRTGMTLALSVTHRRPYHKGDGRWTEPKPVRLSAAEIPLLPNAADREAISLLASGRNSYGGYYYSNTLDLGGLSIPLTVAPSLVPHLARTGRLMLERGGRQTLLEWDGGAPWEFRVEVRRDESGERYLVEGALHRGEEQMPLRDPVLLTEGLVFTDSKIARLDDGGAFDWIVMLRRDGRLLVPSSAGEDLVHELIDMPRRPPLVLPEELRWEEIRIAPRPRLQLGKQQKGEPFGASLSFDYDGTIAGPESTGSEILDASTRKVVVREPASEAAAAARLGELGFLRRGSPPQWTILPSQVLASIPTLIAEGWLVEAAGKGVRAASGLRSEITSGVDWFELHGEASYGEETVKLPDLLAALRRGEKMIQLGDGSFGLLPEEWLARYSSVAAAGKSEDDHLRFTRSQAGFLDALLAAQPEISYDKLFEKTRKRLQRFAGITPASAPRGFTGVLRPYQKEGLGWFKFLEEFDFGGCLADDMGLGKTVQVLALLESRRAGRRKDGRKPSLIVVPKSLVFNWKDESARFTPKLEILDHTGIERKSGVEHFGEYDVVLTTYGTLRREVDRISAVEFDYAILDEAQAIKNATTQAAKSVRLLKADHRLALSGTPIENHLGELWSLFEFLNPGVLGASSAFRKFGAGARTADQATRAMLARALRPYILRRTKGEVAKELPERTEQTIFCEMEAKQRKTYDELRRYYRRSLQQRIDTVGINKAKIQVLEALLRLRQAACHPGLIDPLRRGEPSAKLDALIPQIQEVLEEKHKILVFSQFTSFLSIVRERLDGVGIPYCYLDGKSNDRAEQVERFQTGAGPAVFLISLKAGGLGLNLTAAEYVFLLDPWWNPAVEAQAIDRAHRIGQTRHVFAYRLVCRDTVEEKILELQQSKRDLADAILSAEGSVMRKLRAEDIQMLFSG